MNCQLHQALSEERQTFEALRNEGSGNFQQHLLRLNVATSLAIVSGA